MVKVVVMAVALKVVAVAMKVAVAATAAVVVMAAGGGGPSSGGTSGGGGASGSSSVSSWKQSGAVLRTARELCQTFMVVPMGMVLSSSCSGIRFPALKPPARRPQTAE